MALGLNSSSWEALVQASPEALQNDASVVNVIHILSKAVTRGPQKVLATLVIANFAPTVGSPAGQRIIHALIQFGTVKTISQLCEHLSHLKIEEMHDSPVIALIIRAIAVRVDDNSEQRKELLHRIAKSGFPSLLAVKWSLNFAAELALSESTLFDKLVTNPKSLSTLKSALEGAAKPKEAIHFVETLLSKCDESQKARATELVVRAISESISPKAQHRARNEVLQSLAAFGDPSTIGQVATAMSKWEDLGQLVGKPDSARTFASILTRSDEGPATRLAEGIIASSNMSELSNSKHAAVLEVLSVLQKRFPGSCSKHSVHMGSMVAADIRFTKATKPKFAATKDRIMEKIKLLSNPAVVPKEAPTKVASTAAKHEAPVKRALKKRSRSA